MEAFRASGPTLQVEAVCVALKQEDWTPLKWFCEIYNPRLNNAINSDLDDALRDPSLLNTLVLEAMNVPREFVTLMRLWSRLGKAFCVLYSSLDGFEVQVCECTLAVLYQIIERFSEQHDLVEDTCVAVGALATNRK